MLAPDEESRALDALRFSLASEIVELVVLTADDPFLQTLREAVGPARRLWHVRSSDKVSDLLLAGGVGILVLDVQALNESSSRFIAQIRRQFPDLVIVVAGNREAEGEVASLISDGSVYRFIHKPMSPARARLFAEAAVRRYEEYRKRSVRPVPAGTSRKAVLLFSAACALGCAVLIGLGMARRHAHEKGASLSPAPAAAASASASIDLGVVPRPPPADSLPPASPLPGASPPHAASRAPAASPPPPATSATALASPPPPTTSATAPNSPPPATPPAAVRPATHADAAQADQFAALALECIQEHRLLDPPGDNASFYVQQALQADPRNEAAQQAQEALALSVLAAGREAIDRGDFTSASSWLEAAAGIAAPANVENLRQSLAAARRRAEADAAEAPEPPR